eukprot:tig00000551_g2030.t1
MLAGARIGLRGGSALSRSARALGGTRDGTDAAAFLLSNALPPTTSDGAAAGARRLTRPFAAGSASSALIASRSEAAASRPARRPAALDRPGAARMSSAAPLGAPPVRQEEEDMHLSSYDYVLPEERIAQNPAVPRDTSRLFAIDLGAVRRDGALRGGGGEAHFAHRVFRELPELLRPGDLLVMNDTRVVPARLYGRKLPPAPGSQPARRTDPAAEGAHCEVLLLEEREKNLWLALVRPGRRLRPGARVGFFESEGAGEPALTAEIESVDEASGGRMLRFLLPPGQPFLPLLERLGKVPLPPYITQSTAAGEQYQTVYGKEAGSAAAPTAGLHFTEELLARLEAAGVARAFVTLHVGLGTFRPVEAAHIAQHAMHDERVHVPSQTVEAIEACRARGGRVIAVGTTAARALEGAAQAAEARAGSAGVAGSAPLAPFFGRTSIFIYPGYQWRVVQGMVTNFHLPKSSLMMMVSALMGRRALLATYAEALEQRYRFYSFGDAMCLLPPPRT